MNIIRVKTGYYLIKIRLLLIKYPEGSTTEQYCVPESVIEIADYAFKNGNLNKITLNNGLKTVGAFAFMDCRSIDDEIVIPNSVTSIGQQAFYHCGNLTTVSIGNGVTAIGENAFYFCYSLENINVSEDNEKYSSADGVLFNKDKTELIIYPSENNRTTYTVPAGVTKISQGAFEDCDKLTEIILPYSVSTIGMGAFDSCTNLKRINLENNIKLIGAGAFVGCESLRQVSIPNGVTSIESSTFSGCGLTSITIGENVIEIGEQAFEGCGYLTEVKLPNSVKTIGEYAFYESGLRTIDMPEHMISIGAYAFAYCLKLENIAIPNGIKYIDVGTFGACIELSDVSIPNSVNCIGFAAFWGCSDLTEITIPKNVVRLGMEAFSSATALTKITVYGDIKEMGYGAFGYCTSLAEVYLDDGVTVIGDLAFYCCGSLKKINIPDSVTEIGAGAFYECEKIADVYYSGTEEEWNKIAIEAENESLLNATIHFNYPPVHVCEYTTFVRYEDAHPHYAVYKCECGAEQVSTEASYIASCTICNSVVTSIRVDSAPATTSYQYKADTSLDGLKVIAVYSDNSEVDVTDSVKVSGYDTLSTGDKTATVEFEGCTATFDYTVNYVWWQWIIRILLLGFLWY